MTRRPMPGRFLFRRNMPAQFRGKRHHSGRLWAWFKSLYGEHFFQCFPVCHALGARASKCYGKRSLVETPMGRYKGIIGAHLKTWPISMAASCMIEIFLPSAPCACLVGSR